MTQADRIREYVVQQYIEPARREQRTEVSILARDIRSEMGLPIDQTAVMQALIRDNFLNQNGLELAERLGEGQGWRGVRYRLLRTGYSPDPFIPRGDHEPTPTREQGEDWRKQVLELPIEEFRELFSDYLKAKGFPNADVEIVIRTRGQG